MDNEIVSHLIDIKEGIAGLESKVDNLTSTVQGNGQPGLVQKVSTLENEKWWVRGIGSGIVFILGILEWLIHRKP